MAKHEFIETSEIVYVNAPISPILQGDSVHYEDIAFKAQIGRIHSFSEQDIVKPYLEKIKAEIQKLRGCTCSCSDGIIDDVEDIIDKCEAESEGV